MCWAARRGPGSASTTPGWRRRAMRWRRSNAGGVRPDPTTTQGGLDGLRVPFKQQIDEVGVEKDAAQEARIHGQSAQTRLQVRTFQHRARQHSQEGEMDQVERVREVR